jgi:hypothetical protein
MKNKAFYKGLARHVFWGVAVLIAAQLYWLRELFVLWILFSLGFCILVVTSLACFFLLKGTCLALGWLGMRVATNQISPGVVHASKAVISKG